MPFRRFIRLIPLALALLNGCAAAGPATDVPSLPAVPAPPAPAPQPEHAGRGIPLTFPPSDWRPFYFPEFDRAARALRLAPLRSIQLPAGEEEVRAWIGGGLGYPRLLYRVRRGGGRVQGEVFQYWLMDDDPAEPDSMRYEALIRRRARGECGPLMQAAGYEGCAALFTKEPNWAEVMGMAEAAGLWRLPDEGSLATRRIVLDGWTLVVELRSGAKYRTYKYASPGRDHTEASAAALKVAGVFGGAARHMRRSKIVLVYRGEARTGPGYRSEFRPCASDAVWGLQGNLPGFSGGRLDGPPADPAAAGSQRHFLAVVGELTPEWLARRWRSPYTRVLQVYRVVRATPWTPDACAGVAPPAIP